MLNKLITRESNYRQLASRINSVLRKQLGVLFVCSLIYSVLNLLSASADEWFEVNGKRVPRNVYDAALLMNDATKLIRDNCIDRAMGKLKRAVLLAPDMPEVRSNLAVLLARQGKISEAKTHLLKAVSSPDAPDTAFLNLATLYQTSGDLDKAIENYDFYSRRTKDKMTQAAVDLLRKERAMRAAAAGGKKLQDDYLTESNYATRIRWADSRMPLKVYIERPRPDLEGYKESYTNSLRQSFYDWSKSVANRVRFTFVPSERAADIRCYWTNDPRYLGDGAEAGETRMKSLGHVMVSADIYLRAHEESGDFPYTDTAVKATCLHEIGHALGIVGHSLSVSDIMFFSTPFADGERQLSKRDKNTLARLYCEPMDVNSSAIDFLLNPETYRKWGVIAIVGAAVLIPVCIGLSAALKKVGKKKKNKKRR